jgi:excisionase family DNA binding protein
MIRAYSIAQLARRLSVSRSWLYQEIGAGRLRITKFGRRTVVLQDDARQWLSALQEKEAA